MNAILTARERARAELTQAIKDGARRQLAEVGADGLSLRAVARELGMVSSALYRYFPSKEELLTALIIDAYDALGEAVESAVDIGQSPIDQWQAACHATRAWARAHPHEYALIYGSPIPGYRAPRDTVAPASRVALVIVGVVRRGHDGAVPQNSPELPDGLAAQLADLEQRLAPGVPAPVLARVLVAWTQLFGMISFELFGQLVGSVDPSDDFFAYAVDQMATYVGL